MKMIMNCLRLVVILVFCLTSAACKSSSKNIGGYPYPGSEIIATGAPLTHFEGPYPEAPLPVAPAFTMTPLVVPTPGKETGVVVGQIFFAETNEPMAYHTIYLGFKVFVTPGPGYTIGLTEQGSPHAMSDSEGRFAIGNVPPGTYLLVVWSALAASAVQDPKTGTDLEVVVKAGEVTDLGRLEANALLK